MRIPIKSLIIIYEKKIASDLENNHTGRKLSTMAIRLGFLIEIFFI